MYRKHCTTDVPRHHEYGFWREVIADTYFHLQLGFRDNQGFKGSLQAWELGMVSMSRLESNALRYQRQRQHCQVSAPQILVTMPMQSSVEFTQLGRTTVCNPGQFILERSDEPYEFSYGEDNSMWVLKVPETTLNARVGNTSRFCARHFDSAQGMGQLFRDYLHLITQHGTQPQTDPARNLMGAQLVDLLCMALSESPSALQSSVTSVRRSHLVRMEAYVRQHLADPQLTPASLARHHGISVRYLHDLFKDTGKSVSHWIRELRLQSAHEQLQTAAPGSSIAQIAYGCGFNDQAQFNHAFKKHYDYAPGELIRKRTAAAPN